MKLKNHPTLVHTPKVFSNSTIHHLNFYVLLKCDEVVRFVFIITMCLFFFCFCAKNKLHVFFPQRK